MDRLLIIFFDDYGVEQLHDITGYEQDEQEKMFAVLAGQEYEGREIDFNYMRLRARYNTPRNYHLIGIKLSEDVTDEIIYDSLSSGENNTLRKLIIKHGIDLS
jgi:hypothetical protein